MDFSKNVTTHLILLQRMLQMEHSEAPILFLAITLDSARGFNVAADVISMTYPQQAVGPHIWIIFGIPPPSLMFQSFTFPVEKFMALMAIQRLTHARYPVKA